MNISLSWRLWPRFPLPFMWDVSCGSEGSHLGSQVPAQARVGGSGLSAESLWFCCDHHRPNVLKPWCPLLHVSKHTVCPWVCEAVNVPCVPVRFVAPVCFRASQYNVVLAGANFCRVESPYQLVPVHVHSLNSLLSQAVMLKPEEYNGSL